MIGQLLLLALSASATSAVTQPNRTESGFFMQIPSERREQIEAVSPAYGAYSQRLLLGELWQRPQLSRRDRSIVTVAALIAKNQTRDMRLHFGLALDNGVTPAELSEIITHLAFYAGWPNAASAIDIAYDVFHDRRIGQDQLTPERPTLLRIDQIAEDAREARVQESVGPVSPGLVDYTRDTLFHEVWLRPGLAPRDRSLITVAALVANGNTGQISGHLTRAMDNGLTRVEAGEILTQVAFYAGWPAAFTAAPAFKAVFDERK
ncbi:carboxymuconolactone decarboxylase family protein [Sphingomonas tabacisoli]|uniref:Carboxymuconolactone decarboxylase family protein n=1 Tax=Sphingomonas tabacisoli TaxID=2249466 RepID=A0ABW4I7N7_9SPHN